MHLQVIPIESIGNSFCKSYKGISYRFYSFVPININSVDLCILFFVPKIPGNTEQQHVVRTVLSMIDVAIFQIIIQREGRKKAEKK